MLSRVREDAEYFGLAALVAAVDAHTEAAEVERTRMQEAEDAKRLGRLWQRRNDRQRVMRSCGSAK